MTLAVTHHEDETLGLATRAADAHGCDEEGRCADDDENPG